MKCIFLGYMPGVKKYKLWCPETKKLVISKDVIFDDTAIIHGLAPKVSYDNNQQRSKRQVELEIDTMSTIEIGRQSKPEIQRVDTPLPPPQYSIAKDRERRSIKAP